MLRLVPQTAISAVYYAIGFSLTLWVLLSLHHIQGVKLLLGDEVWASAAANGSLLDSLVFTLRWDVHPPVYYMMVHLWSYISMSDIWLLLNSAILHVLSVIMVFHYVYPKTNLYTGLLTALLVFCCPLLFEYSNMLRMYAWLCFLSLGLLLVSDKIIASQMQQKKFLLYYASIALLLCFSHVLGVFFLFFHFVYVALTWLTQPKLKVLLHWSLFNLVLALVGSLAVINSLLRSVSHAITPDIDVIITSLSHVFFGETIPPFIGMPILLGLIILALINERSRHYCIAFVLLPFIVFALTSYFIKPIWLDRNFTFMAAIALLTFALSTSTTANTMRGSIVQSLLLILFAGNIYHLAHVLSIPKPDDQISYSALYQHLNTQPRTTKTCYMTQGQMPMFWGSLRYVHGYEWGSPMAVQPKANERWQVIIDKVPKAISQFLDLNVQTNYLEKNNLVISSRFSSRCFAQDVQSAYIIMETQSVSPMLLEQATVTLNTDKIVIIQTNKTQAEAFFTQAL